MQQIYQQQMQAQVNTTMTNEERKSSGLEALPDVAGLSLDGGAGDDGATIPALDELENRADVEKSDLGTATDPTEDGEDHQCSEECGFCSDDESKRISFAVAVAHL